MANKIQLRRDTAVAWYDANPKLSQGEPGVEIDTGKLKIGDGIAFWRTLPYVNSTDLPSDAQGYLANDGDGNLSWISVSGTQGVQGVQGVQGRQGVQGITGNQGVQGITGNQGIQGITGQQGTQGTQGITGDQGVQGITGDQGTQGITGQQGTQGITGDQGVQGITGDQGTQGITGQQGTQGITGSRGDTGLGFTIAKTYSSVAALTADTTPTGIITGQFAIINTSDPNDLENSRLYLWNGSTWAYVTDLSGAAGIQGIQGTQGTQGTQGITGQQGTQGITGDQGTQGITGDQGTQGITGQQGTQGIQGITGNQGTQGITGNQGIQGTRGINGSSTSVFDYTANFNQLDGNPGAGYITWDNVNQISSSNVNISHLNANSEDIDIILSLIDLGQKLTIQSKSDSGSYQAWLVTGDITNVNPGTFNSYWQIPVTLISSNSKGTSGFFHQDQLLISVTSAAVQGAQGLQGAAGGGGGGNGAQGIQGITGPQGPGIYESDTPPSDTDLLWYDTVNGRLYLYYDSSWVDASPKGGSQGIQGTQGTQAAQGIQGQQGIQGRQGIQGTQAAQGVQGIQGIQGVQGIQGTQAAQGVQGNQGVQGTRAAEDRLVNGVKEAVLGADGNLAAPSGGNITVSGGGKFVGDGSQLTNLTVNQASNIIGSEPNVTLVAGSYSYLFDNTGTFTLPENGDILMPGANANLTAGGTVFATKFASYTGSWTLAAGANTVSLTVPINGTYSIWVRGNIPSGIVAYTATVVVTNTNVPVLGSSYGWYYVDGNQLVLTAIPTQIIGTANNISTATVSTTTANVFTFGITNNSGSSKTVDYGYTRLG